MNTIQTNTNYVVSKKLLSIHSDDRDLHQWPDPNQFEITAPVEYKNVVSLRLNDIELPSSYYIFSTMNQNTKLTFQLFPVVLNWPEDIQSIATNLVDSPAFTLFITSGSYTPEQVSDELAGTLNQIITDYLKNTYNIDYKYTFFTVTYNPVKMKLSFLNEHDNFQFDFTKAEYYDHLCDTKNLSTPVANCYSNYTNWGLGSYLGFDKKIYASNELTIISSDSINNLYKYLIEPDHVINLNGDSHIYMELAYCNSMDEITPYTYKSNASNNAKFGGKHNSAFAKIPLLTRHLVCFSHVDSYLSNIFFSDPPLERIQKFKIKMRHHDGRLVDFNNCNYNFTIEITMLKPDSIKPFIKVNSSNYNL